jgi:hypothetical protein
MNGAVPPQAARMRRTRARRKQGTVFVRLEIVGTGIDRLIGLGWLREADRSDRAKVGLAVLGLADAAILANLSPRHRGLSWRRPSMGRFLHNGRRNFCLLRRWSNGDPPPEAMLPGRQVM